MAAVNAYEAQRAARIAENKRRMEELGLLKVVADFNAVLKGAARVPKNSRGPSQPRIPRDINLPKRRSGRNAGAPAPNYDESALDRIKEKGTRTTMSERHVASQDEVYTADDIKKLGTYENEWELFVDGYDEEGNRVYDKERGQTCHQCRQKTLGRHTACSQCSSLRGVFCGDCLFMRYGENLAEVMEEGKEWVCPVCRDLCNCSFHRIRKGWAPTGTLYRRAIKDGFKSVAHYLVLTHQAPAAEAVEKPQEAAAPEPGTVSLPAPSPAPPTQLTPTPAANAVTELLKSAAKAYTKTRGNSKKADLTCPKAVGGGKGKANDKAVQAPGVASKGIEKAVRVTRFRAVAAVA